jgi:integrase
MRERTSVTYAAWGESSIHQDDKGRWHGYVSMGTKQRGARDRRHVSGATRAAVVQRVRALEAARDAGTVVTSGRGMTLQQWLDHWLATIAVHRLAPKTLDSYGSHVRNHIGPHLGHHRLDRLQPEHLERFYVELAREGLSPATVLLNHRIVSRALKVAMQRGRVGRNVAQLVEPPSVQRPEVEPLTADEARRILHAAENVPNAARWSVALALGLRQGEALGLMWQDIDLERGTLRVRRALQRQPGKGLVLVKPKSRAGLRTLVLPPNLLDGMRRHQLWQEEQRAAAAEAWEEHGFVFAQPNGHPIGAPADWKAWKDLLAAAGVRPARLHDARHTAATLLLQQGIAARVAMQLLGHSQISMTMHYTHVVPELAEEAALRIDDALWGQPDDGSD